MNQPILQYLQKQQNKVKTQIKANKFKQLKYLFLRFIIILQSMSVYSGFATRAQQQNYDQYTYNIIFILAKRIMKYYTNTQVNQYKFQKTIKELYHKLLHLEKHKYLSPNFSDGLHQISKFIEQYGEQQPKQPEIDHMNPQNQRKRLRQSNIARSPNSLWVEKKTVDQQTNSQSSKIKNKTLKNSKSKKKTIQSRKVVLTTIKKRKSKSPQSNHNYSEQQQRGQRHQSNQSTYNHININHKLQNYDFETSHQLPKQSKIKPNSHIDISSNRKPESQRNCNNNSNPIKKKVVSFEIDQNNIQHKHRNNMNNTISASFYHSGKHSHIQQLQDENNQSRNKIQNTNHSRHKSTMQLEALTKLIPEEVKNYLDMTNRTYMNNFRKRKCILDSGL